ncbi:MAG: formyltransferase family protein, partial [Bilophila sp.]
AMHDSITGGTAYWMNDGADTGSIEAQDWCHVLPDDTPAELWRRALAPMGVRLLTACVTQLASGAPPRRIPQDERVATWEPAILRTRLG